ncbi:MAG: response regulator [Deltaproteobacteria bacterium]|nr:response regulator [Deltaproteobacteria bacterium]
MKVLIADDSRLVRGIVERAVVSDGFEALQAANGKDALNILETAYQDVRIVLLDWNMPVLNGIDVIKNMRRDDRFNKIPVLMVSTESEEKRIQEAVTAGAQGYLTKPFTPDQLKNAIHQVLDKK